MNDIRDRKRITTLPKDLREIANQMLGEKFDLPKQGEVVKDIEKATQKAKASGQIQGQARDNWDSTATNVNWNPIGGSIDLIDQIHKYYYMAREHGGSPGTLFMHPETRYRLLKNPRANGYTQFSPLGDDIFMGMKIRTEPMLSPDRMVLAEERSGSVVFDSDKGIVRGRF